MVEVRCPNCQTSFVIGSNENAVTELKDGINYLVPETVRNENAKNSRFEALRKAGVNVDKLQELMQTDSLVGSIFDDDDPILEAITMNGFIKNKKLFRRWITAQTFRLIKDPKGWTHAVRQTHDTKYVFKQTLAELRLLVKLKNKSPDDKRFSFFTLENMRGIFLSLLRVNRVVLDSRKEEVRNDIIRSLSYGELLHTVTNCHWMFRKHSSFFPKEWLNCYKGAGAYYTLQNIIRTHGLVLPQCKDMNESLKCVDDLYSNIMSYQPCNRRWDLMMSLLTTSVRETKFELKY